MLNLGGHYYLCNLTLIHCNTIVTLSVLLKYVCTVELLHCLDIEEVPREVSSTFKGSFFDFQRKFLRLPRFASTSFGIPFWFYTSLIYMIVYFFQHLSWSTKDSQTRIWIHILYLRKPRSLTPGIAGIWEVRRKGFPRVCDSPKSASDPKRRRAQI